MLSAARQRNDLVEVVMVTIYIVLTPYLFVCNCPPRIAFALRDAVAPFQIKVRARKAGAERSTAVWQSSQFESRTPTVSPMPTEAPKANDASPRASAGTKRVGDEENDRTADCRDPKQAASVSSKIPGGNGRCKCRPQGPAAVQPPFCQI